MSIHGEIKKRRLAKGWSLERLAEEVSKLEGLKKSLGWQTVQQWENGTSAPKRTRLTHVATALGCTQEELAFPIDGESGEDAETASSFPPSGFVTIRINMAVPEAAVLHRMVHAAGLPGVVVERSWTRKESPRELPMDPSPASGEQEAAPPMKHKRRPK